MAQAGEGRSVKKALVDWTRGSVLIVIRNRPSKRCCKHHYRPRKIRRDQPPPQRLHLAFEKEVQEPVKRGGEQREKHEGRVPVVVVCIPSLR